MIKMNQTEDHQILQGEVAHEFYMKRSKYRLLKRSVLFLITIIVFSLFLCFSSGFSIFPNSCYVYFNTCLFSYLTRTFERKYMFIISNGILAFLAKSSISSSFSSSGSYIYHYGQLPLSNISIAKPAVGEDTVSQEEVALVEEEEEGDNQEKDVNKEENEDLFAEDDDKGEERKGVLDKQNKGEDEAEGEGEKNDDVTNTEDLNRRIEEFIRKMKEEIRIESQRQLIAA